MGQHQPQRWQVALSDGRPVGVAAAARHHEGVKLPKDAFLLVGGGVAAEPSSEAREVGLPWVEVKRLAGATGVGSRHDRAHCRGKGHQPPVLVPSNLGVDKVSRREALGSLGHTHQPLHVVASDVGPVVDIVLLQQEGHQVHVLEDEVHLIAEAEGGGPGVQQLLSGCEGAHVGVLAGGKLLLGVVIAEGAAPQPDHLQLPKDGAQVPVGALHQAAHRRLIHLEALTAGYVQHPLRDLHRCRPSVVQLHGVVPQGLELLGVLVVADAHYGYLGLRDDLDEVCDATAVAPTHAVHLVHDDHRAPPAQSPARAASTHCRVGR
mmetsp:Transcript_23724/g.65841  ORF Transcript_23724/g.65841 Transcript_23724/m.65841 type:complete len:320 (+) Transcript_23724:351-1310(+)